MHLDGVFQIVANSHLVVLDSCDLLLIDGDHSYAAVKGDWDRHKDVAPIIAFHDIHDPPPAYAESEVHVLWKQLRSQYETVEIYYGNKDGYDHAWGGIGVIFKEKKARGRPRVLKPSG